MIKSIPQRNFETLKCRKHGTAKCFVPVIGGHYLSRSYLEVLYIDIEAFFINEQIKAHSRYLQKKI